jgi:O-antigen/teichoic acid export membrane protein
MASPYIKPLSLWITKFQQWGSVLQFRPFSTDTPEGRAKERLRRVLLTALVSAFAQAVNMLTMLVSIPLTLNYLGVERYGLWIVISSLITILGFADLGLGNGLLNAIADANGRKDRSAAESYVSSAFYMLSGVTLILGSLWIIVSPLVTWNWLFNVTAPQAIAETSPALSIFVWCMLISLPFGLAQKIHDGYQEGYVNGLWRAGGSLLGLASVLLAIYFRAGLPLLVLAMAGTPALLMVFNALLLFCGQRPELRPQWKLVSKSASTRILKNGMLFFVLQLAVVIGFQSDTLIVARFLGVNQVPQYAIPMRLFMLIPSLLNLVIAPLWPAYAEAIARRDVAWVHKSFYRSLFLAAGFSLPLSTLFIIFGDRIIQLWAGDQIQPNLLLLLGIGLWTVLVSLAAPISVLLNGANVIRFQVICASFMALGNLAFSIILVQKVGISGPVLASSISWVTFSLLPTVLYLPRLFASWTGMKILKYSGDDS